VTGYNIREIRATDSHGWQEGHMLCKNYKLQGEVNKKNYVEQFFLYFHITGFTQFSLYYNNLYTAWIFVTFLMEYKTLATKECSQLVTWSTHHWQML